MKLAQYMAEENLSPAQLAELIQSVSASGARKWMNGERIPRPDEMRKIHQLTGGRVSPNDFILETESAA